MEYHCERQARLKPANLGSSSPLASCSCNDALFTLHDPTVSHFSLFLSFQLVGKQQQLATRWHTSAESNAGKIWLQLIMAAGGRRSLHFSSIGGEMIVASAHFFITSLASSCSAFFQKSDRDLFGGMISQLHRCDNLALFSGQCWMCINSVRGI